MKILALALIAAAAAPATPATVELQLPSDIPAASDLGRSLLSKSRRLGGDDEEDSYAWMTGYSLKFQGCRHHTSLNLDGDEDGDDDYVRVRTTSLAHFRLCPSASCSSWRGGGCSRGYGDYVVGLQTFAKTYAEGRKRAREYECQMYVYENCDCAENDDRDDGFDRDYCEYDCYAASKHMQDCIDRNPYEEEEEGEREERFEAERYAECEEWDPPENDDDGGNRDNDDEAQYYIGPYCSDNGGEVYLGMFTEETCTNFVDSDKGVSTFKAVSGGEDLPYSSTSLVASDCILCVEQEDPNRQDEEDEDDNGDAEPEVSDQCARLYESAGKCESAIDASGMSSDPDTAACSFITGIRFADANGVVGAGGTSRAATLLAVFFAAVFAGLAGLVYKLRRDIEEARRSPLLEKEDSQEDVPALS